MGSWLMLMRVGDGCRLRSLRALLRSHAIRWSRGVRWSALLRWQRAAASLRRADADPAGTEEGAANRLLISYSSTTHQLLIDVDIDYSFTTH